MHAIGLVGIAFFFVSSFAGADDLDSLDIGKRHDPNVSPEQVLAKLYNNYLHVTFNWGFVIFPSFPRFEDWGWMRLTLKDCLLPLVIDLTVETPIYSFVCNSVKFINHRDFISYDFA